MLFVDCLIGIDRWNTMNTRWAYICEYVSCGPGQSLICKETYGWLHLLVANSSAVSCLQAYYLFPLMQMLQLQMIYQRRHTSTDDATVLFPGSRRFDAPDA